MREATMKAKTAKTAPKMKPGKAAAVAAAAAAKILAAYDAGCRRFDSAIGGLGGCPFAQDVLVGNIPTETLLEALQHRGFPLPIRNPIADLVELAANIGDLFGGPKM